MPNTYAGANASLQKLQDDGPLMLALFDGVPTPEGNGVELAGPGYQRQQIVFSVPVQGGCINTEVVQFPQALGQWGTMSAWGIYDKHGVMRRCGTFPQKQSISIGFRVEILNGTLELVDYGECNA